MALPETGPGLADQDAVAGVAGVIAEGDGLVKAVAADLIWEHGDVLRAVVDDAGEAIAVDEDFRSGVEALFTSEVAGVEDEAVSDAAVGGEVLPPPPLQLFSRRPARDDESPKGDGRNDDNNCAAGGDAGVDSDGVPDGVGRRFAKGFPEFGVKILRGVVEIRNHGLTKE